MNSNSKKSASSWRINWTVAIVSLLLALLLGPAAWGWHRYAVRRNGQMFLSRADAHEKEGQWMEAADDLFRYLRLYPDNEEVRIRLAKTYDQATETSPRRLSTAEWLSSVAVGLAPDRDDLRRLHAQQLLRMGRFPAALAEANELLKLRPEDPQGLYLRAVAMLGDARLRGNFTEPDTLVKALDEAIAAMRGQAEHIELAEELADLYERHLKDPDEATRKQLAQQALDAMVAACPEHPDAWMSRYFYKRRFGERTAADADLDQALALDHDCKAFRVQLAAGQRAAERGAFEKSVEYFRRAAKASPTTVMAYTGLAQAYAAQNEMQQATDALREGIKQITNEDSLILELLLTEMLIQQDQLADAETLLNSMAKRIDGLLGQRETTTLNELQGDLESLRGRWHMAHRDYSAAARAFKKSLFMKQAVPANSQEAIPRARLCVDLGQSLVALRRFDEAAQAFEQAAELQPLLPEPRLLAARAWRSAGRLDEAILLCRQATRLETADLNCWLALAEAQLQYQFSRPADQRSWNDVDETLATAKQRFESTEQLAALETALNDIRTGGRRTLEQLESRYQQTPDSIPLAENLVLAYEQEGNRERAETVLKDLEQKESGRAAAVQLKAELMAARGNTAEAEQLLATSIAGLPPAEQRAATIRLARMYARSNKLPQARALLTALADQDSADELVLGLLADFELQAGDPQQLAQWVERLKKAEGTDGTVWRYYEAERLLMQASDLRDPQVHDAGKLADEIQKLRPAWPAGFALEGRIEQRLGKIDAAIAAFQTAFELGDARQLEPLATLLYANNRLEELTSLLNGADLASSPRLTSLSVLSRIRRKEFAEAVALARQRVDANPQFAPSYVLLGQALLASGDSAGAQTAFRQAVDIAPKDSAAWQALIGYFLQVQNLDGARATLDEMVTKVDLPPLELQILVGHDRSLLGDAAGAQAAYRAALQLDPKSVIALRGLASSLAATEPAEAEQLLRRALEISDNPVVRGELVSLLASQGGEARMAEAWRLITTASLNPAEEDSVQSLKARVLLRRANVGDREQAKRILESLVSQEDASDSDRLALISLYRSEGNLTAASRLVTPLVNRAEPRPELVAVYADLLLAEGKNKEASVWVSRLKELAPNTLGTVAIEARLLAAEGRATQAEEVIRAFLDEQLADPRNRENRRSLLLAAGDLYTRIERDAAAEEAYRRLAAESEGDQLPLANWLAGHNRVSEAIDLCLSANASSDGPQAVAMLVRSLIIGKPQPADVKRAEPAIQQALQKFGDNTDYLFVVATWRLVRQQHDEAERLLHRVLAQQPEHIQALNNLANLLAMQDDRHTEALRYVDEAIDRAGRLAELLDTRGIILLKSGRLNEAAASLQEAVGQTPTGTDPRYQLHLAAVYDRLGKREEALRLFQQAQANELQATVLSPDDVQWMNELTRNLRKSTDLQTSARDQARS